MFNKIHIKTTGLLVLFIYAVINIAFPFIEVRKAYAGTPVCVYPPGAYDPSSGYCVTNPLDEKHSCPQYYTFNYETNKCVLMPVCNGMYVYNKNTKQCDPIEATTGDGESSWTMPANACAVDSNGDGEVQQNEIFACTQTPQGYICPQGQTECTEQISQPECPAGYTFNGQTQKCEASTTIGVCSSQSVPYTDYQCPTNGQVYADAATCNNNCIQYAACNAVPFYLFANAVNVNTGQSTPTNIGIRVYRSSTSPCTNIGFSSASTIVQVMGQGNWFEITAWDRWGYDSQENRCIDRPIVEYRVYASNYCTFSGSLQYMGSMSNDDIFYYIYGEGNRIRVYVTVPAWGSPQEAYIYVSGCTVSGFIQMFSGRKGGGLYNNSCVSGNTIYGCSSASSGWSSGSLTFTPNNPYTCPLPGGSSCSGNPPTCSVGQSCVTHTSYTNKYQCSLNGVFYDTQAQCTTSCYSGCPAGGSFNSQTGKCEAPIDEGSITVSGEASMGYGTFRGEGNKLCHVQTGTCLEFSLHSGQIVVTGQMSKPNEWTFVGSGNQMIATYLASPCDGHYSTGKFVFNFSQGNITIVPQTSPLAYIVSGCYFHAAPNGNQIAFYNGPTTGSITFTYNPGTACPSGTLQANGCFTGYGCPLGNYQCMNVNNKWMCSSNQCFTESQVENDDPDIIASTYDSTASNEDICTGEWSIFSGSKMRCQKSGIKTGFHNCCDESQGKIYDSVGSTGISAITDAVGAIYAATEAVKIGSYAYGIATGAISVGDFSTDLITIYGPDMPLTTFYENSKEFAALSEAVKLKQAGASADEVVGTAMGTYIEKMGPQIAAAIAQLAISQVISDPVIASAVNLAFSASLWIAGSAGGPVGFALSAATLAANLFMASCDKQDIITSTMEDSGMCHYVGTYCTKKIKFVGCVQKVKSYCCFNSKLARIVHEQGRPQLASFGPDGGWGSEKHPNCRGFKPEEFQALNFDNIDLSEYTQDIERNMRKNIESSLQNTATQSLQNRGVVK